MKTNQIVAVAVAVVIVVGLGFVAADIPIGGNNTTNTTDQNQSNVTTQNTSNVAQDNSTTTKADTSSQDTPKTQEGVTYDPTAPKGSPENPNVKYAEGGTPTTTASKVPLEH